MENPKDREFVQECIQMFATVLSEVDNKLAGQYNFKKDIETGELGEEFIKNFLVDKGFEYLKNNKDREYDLLMSIDDRQIQYEIKTDVYVSTGKDTGNLPVEFGSRGIDSGIRTTTSEYWVTYFVGLRQVWNIKTENLKTLILENDFREYHESGDKGSKTKLYLIPRESFRKYFRVYDIP